MDFNVKDNLVCISQIQNNPGDILNDIVGVYYKLPKLIRVRYFTKFCNLSPKFLITEHAIKLLSLDGRLSKCTPR